MTREDAIIILMRHKNCFTEKCPPVVCTACGYYVTKDDLATAYIVAINALIEKETSDDQRG